MKPPKFQLALTPNFCTDDGIRQFHAIRCKNGGWLSIQASLTHYCSPRETLSDLNTYTSWEVALVADKGGLLNPDENDPDFGPFVEYWAGDCVAGYMPTEKVQALYEAACL